MEPSQKDLYSVLNVPRTATPEQIRSAYRELTKAFLGGSTGSSSSGDPSNFQAPPARNFSLQDISTAFNVLSNPIKRAEYDLQFNPLVEGAAPNAFNHSAHQPASVLASHVAPNEHASPPRGQENSPPHEPPVNHHERIGRVNNTEFITNKPAAAFSAGSGLRGPFGVTDSHLARSDSHKIKPMKDLLGPIFSDRKRLPAGVMIAIFTGSLSIGIIIALIVRSLIHS